MDLSRVVVSEGYSPVAVHRLLIMLASLVVEHGLHGSQASVGAACGLNSFGSQTLGHRLSSCGAWLCYSVAHGIFPDHG